MKKTVENIIEVVAVVAVVVALLAVVSNAVQVEASDEKYNDFYQQSEDFDVLFFGTSRVINAVMPMELWQDYGIVSYNFGGHNNTIPTSYWSMMNALDYTHPKLVVIDCMLVEDDAKVCDNAEYLHQTFDSVPISRTKIKALMDLCDDPELTDVNEVNYYDTRLEYIWDFPKYHSRWSALETEEFEPVYSEEKGAEARVQVADFSGWQRLPVEAAQIDSTGAKYLRMMIEECQNRGIDVMLMYLPYPAPESQQMVAAGVAAIAQEYGVDYVNYLDSDVIDYNTDCYDLGGHLNPSGARKVTTDLGAYIQERYSIPDQRGNEAYGRWNEDDIDYIIYKAKLIDEQEELDNTLMLLADDDFTTTVTMRPDSQVYTDPKLGCLVSNIADCIMTQEDIPEEIHIRVTDNYYNTTVLDSGWVYYKGRFYKNQQ